MRPRLHPNTFSHSPIDNARLTGAFEIDDHFSSLRPRKRRATPMEINCFKFQSCQDTQQDLSKIQGYVMPYEGLVTT